MEAQSSESGWFSSFPTVFLPYPPARTGRSGAPATGVGEPRTVGCRRRRAPPVLRVPLPGAGQRLVRRRPVPQRGECPRMLLRACSDTRAPAAGGRLSPLIWAGTLFVLAGHVGNGSAGSSRRADGARTPSAPPRFGAGGARRATVYAPAELRGAAGPRRMLHAPRTASYGGTCDAAEEVTAAEFDCSRLAGPSAEFCEDPLFGGDRRCCYDAYGITRAAGSCHRCPRGTSDCVQARNTCTRR